MDDNGMGMMMPPPPSSMPSGGNMDGGMMHDMTMSMMHMTFFWGHHVEILFSGWPGDRGIGMYVLALFVVFVASILVEFIAYVPCSMKNSDRMFSKGLVLTLFAGVRTGLSYLVMLAVMSFNVGVLIAAVVGHALGFFVFGSGIFRSLPRTTNSDHQTTVLPEVKC